jgi:Zincin-like metallopeptidase
VRFKNPRRLTARSSPLRPLRFKDLHRKPRRSPERTPRETAAGEKYPFSRPGPKSGHQRRLLLGVFHGVPTTKKSMFDLPNGPDHLVLYQKNIEAVCSSEAEVRTQIRLTVIHEFGHYFGLDEEQLTDV